MRLYTRQKLAFDWLPSSCRKVLDGGCAFGHGTASLVAKAGQVFGCDPNPEFIARARADYPALDFVVCPLEKMPYDSESFGAVTMTDVLEHVADERAAINEVFRVLEPGGCLIITVPHQGLFSFMDTENYIWILRTKLPRLHRWLFRMKHGCDPRPKPGYVTMHRHYSLVVLVALLDSVGVNYEVERVFRGGLFCYAAASNAFEALSILVGERWATAATKPLLWLANLDYFIPYGGLSYDLGIRVKKLPPSR